MLDHMYGKMRCKYCKVNIRKSIFSHETALHLNEVTDRTPIYYRIIIPNNYNSKDLKCENVKLNYEVNSSLEAGVTQMKTSFGNYIKCYDKEKTICDIIGRALPLNCSRRGYATGNLNIRG